MSVAQWTADQFWRQVQWVAQQGASQKARLDAQKLQLQNAYTAARNANDQDKMTALQPLIHQNSDMRIRWNNLRDQFNSVVNQARSFLAQHGINEPPTLAGLGQLETIIVSAAWVAALVAVIAIVHEIDAGIKAVNDGLQKLGPLGATALALVPLGLVAAALLFLWPRRKAVA